MGPRSTTRRRTARTSSRTKSKDVEPRRLSERRNWSDDAEPAVTLSSSRSDRFANSCPANPDSAAKQEEQRPPRLPGMTSLPSDRPIALVTGANRGLGLETSKQLLDDRYRVVLTSRDPKAGIAAAQKLDPTGKDILFHQLDITDSKSIATLAEDFSSIAPRLDVLVNNAGIGSWGADRRASIRTIETNYFGSRDVTDALLPRIPSGGRIVMVSSGLG